MLISGKAWRMNDPALDYVRHVMDVRGWNAAELARAANVSHSTINRPLTVEGWSHALSRRTIDAIYRATGIDPQPFIGGTIALLPEPSAPQGDLVNVYNVHASAGFGVIVGDESVVDRLAFPPGYLRHITSANPKNLAIIGVKGKSMEPTLSDDDIVMVDLTKTDLSYDGLFVVRDGGDSLLVKRISRGPRRGTVLMVSDNPQYPNQERAFEDVDVVGKVIWKGVKE